jgi:hypothetical protein
MIFNVRIIIVKFSVGALFIPEVVDDVDEGGATDEEHGRQQQGRLQAAIEKVPVGEQRRPDRQAAGNSAQSRHAQANNCQPYAASLVVLGLYSSQLMTFDVIRLGSSGRIHSEVTTVKRAEPNIACTAT